MNGTRLAARHCAVAAWGTAALFAAVTVAAGDALARADAQPVSARYVATVAGVKIGEATITGTVGPAAAGARPFELAIDAKYKVMLWAGRVTATSSGRVAGAGPASSTFTVETHSKETRQARVAIESGTVRKAEINPPLKTEGMVPLGPEQLTGVVDPLSGILIGAIRAASSATGPCAGTLPVYTGWHRFDLAFRPSTPTAVAGAAQAASRTAGDVCEVTVTPIAGHKADSSMLTTLAKSRDIRAEFTRADGSGLALPSRIRVPLWVGEIVVVRQP